MEFDPVSIAEAIRAFETGDIVVVTDDIDRENEGDLIVAASFCTPEKMAFIIRHSSGIVCAPMTAADARRLNLGPMVADNDAPHATAFTVSIDYRHDLTTGISADERTATVRALANPNAGAADFVRPGHIFPLIAREGGVLTRSGHTEAAVDLCRLAGLPPIGVISELMSDDGAVLRGNKVSEFAARHSLKLVSVAELIAWRQRQERHVERISEAVVNTLAGPAKAITYKTPWDPMHHLAVIFGDIRDGRAVPVRMQIESVLDDAFGASDGLQRALKQIAASGRGVVVYLREGSVGVGHIARRYGREPSDEPGAEAEHHGSALSRGNEWLEIGIGAQILRDLGIDSIDLLASRERHYVGLEGFGIRIENTRMLE
jgi:3,4-dihydroxy 2-butanone 4-phosphate synthase / GTP cyclohydrolase II